MRYFLITTFLSFSFLVQANNGTNQVTGLAALEADCKKVLSPDFVPSTQGGINETTKILTKEGKQKCDALLALRGNSQFGKLPFVPLSTSNPSTQNLTQSSTGGQVAQVGCVGSEYALDYKKCKSLVNEINAMGGAEMAMQLLHDQKLKSAQTKLGNEARAAQGDTSVVIGTQIKELEVRIDQNRAFGYFYMGKAADLGTMIKRWPTSKNVFKKLEVCKGNQDIELGCEKLAREHGRELTPNEGFRSQLFKSIQEVGMKGGQILAAQQKMMREKAELQARLGIAQDSLDGTSEFLTTYCQSPEGLADAEKCGAFGINPNYNTTGLANFGDDQEWSAANIGDGSVNGITGDFNPNNPATGEGQDSIRDGLLDFENEKSSGGFIDNPNAATIGQGGGAGAGGGGAGAGGGAGGGAGPGLSTKPNQPGEKELASLTKVKSEGAYAKTKGGFYKKATRSKRTRRSDDDEVKKGLSDLNIFGRAPAEDAPVGPQNIALFDLISDRYEKVKEQGRVKK